MNRILVILLSFLYVLFMASLAGFYYKNDETEKVLAAVAGVLCGAMPLLLLALFLRLQFTAPLIVFYFIFLFCSQYLGSILDWYAISWWDLFLHFMSGVLLAYAAIPLYERMVHRSAGKKVSSWFIFLFTLSFAVLGGVLWEIYEFSMDQFFNMALQGGNKDTMTDLIADTVGGFVMATWAGLRTRS
ncbi:hypothetical protein BTO28_02490 [Domibacillus epiphyticus]|uniref:Membrane-spanning protein n=2 Tax=Domibacillus epiphyticus TaxID=1714355 RepID=A0A1V2ABF8_9BACI|nr:hypothetical protein [Domibacillus epiphyticus]OMP68319.1 hypothetical protein BTO28_02490 [Domibacillus epiphyticus]